MKKIKIAVGTQEREYEVPSCWNELSDEQFLYILGHYAKDDKTPIAIMRHLVGPSFDIDLFVLPIHWNAIYEDSFRWLRSFTGLRVWLPGVITLSDGRECLPPLPDFSNVCWREFVFADTLAQHGNWAGVAACMYRPALPDATEDEDSRVAFSDYGVNARIALFREQDAAVLAAVEICYSTLKSRLASHYPNLFSVGAADRGGKPTSWVEVTHTLLGDSVWNERQLYDDTTVTEVLAYLDRKIKEAKK